MSISLFEHNQTAYDAAIDMLENIGKAAIIHPTGTGKSFIGFKLCEQHPDKRICWLSPSSYIFETQIEGLKQASEGYVPENIQFYTYQKLVILSEDEINDIQPDFIILDEFHRCGAPTWEKAVYALLKIYPDAKLLGLSATNVRYLDSQRDMALELFDGNIASEITLGEAVVRGILNPPKYVLSIFAYQNQLKKYEKRIKTAKSKEVRDKGEKHLEELRRSLESAEGLDQLFYKHMPDHAGKYIVFCANIQHMQQMIELSHEWFDKLDKTPYIYSVYSDNPGSESSFREFKQNSDPSHLKLLYCIDALNEGVHVKDISGVILLRPTISPIIYKQQIGRAMSASARHEIVIFDIVMNIDNLYTISMIEYEMEDAISHYAARSEKQKIVNDQFWIIDEVKDCRLLFNRLNDTLSASWEMMYERAKAFYEKNGHLNVPQKYKTEEGYPLGQWLLTQRKAYKGLGNGILTEQKKSRLDAIGMRWDSYYPDWDHYFDIAKQYYVEHGNLDVPARYITENGVRLGKWLGSMRSSLVPGNKTTARPPSSEQIQKLESIGMSWDMADHIWEKKFAAAEAFYRENGHLNVPSDYVDAKGVNLGGWIAYQRKAYGRKKGMRLSEDRIAKLESIGMVWMNRYEILWQAMYDQAKLYYEEKGNLLVPPNYIASDKSQLGKWISRQRENYSSGKLSQERIGRLEAIGMVWMNRYEITWQVFYHKAKLYYEEKGNLLVPPSYITPDKSYLGDWISRQRESYSSGKLSEERIAMLNEIGMVWKREQPEDTGPI